MPTETTILSTTQVYPLMYLARSSRRIAGEHLDRIQALQDEGFEVHVLAGADGGFDALRRIGVRCRPLPVQSSFNVAGLAGAYFIIQAYFLEHHPALVHVQDQPLSWLGAFAARQAQTPVVVATVERHFLGGALHGAFAAAYRKLAEMVDRYIVTEEEDCQRLKELGLVDEAKLAMVTGAQAEVDVQLMELYDQELRKHFD